jgi:hypothetical protein
MSKPKIKYITSNFFPVYIGIAFCESEYLQEMKRLGVKEIMDFNTHAASVKYLTKGDHLNCVICIDPVKYKHLHRNMMAAMLAHEATHIADLAFEHIGENKPGQETRAYLVQAIVQDALYAMDDFMKSKKGKKHGRKSNR